MGRGSRAHRVRGGQSAPCCGSAALKIGAHGVRGRQGAGVVVVARARFAAALRHFYETAALRRLKKSALSSVANLGCAHLNLIDEESRSHDRLRFESSV